MIANAFTRWLARRLMSGLAKRTITARPADFIIGGADDPYMYRWWVIPRNPVFNVYLHRVVKDDDDRALHDHPFASVSLMLSGLLGEVYAVGRPEHEVYAVRWFEPGAVVWRGARFAHRLFLPPFKASGTPTPQEAWTLFVTGPRIREWGFWCPDKSPAGGWRHWKDFTAAGTTGDSATIGRGCGE